MANEHARFMNNNFISTITTTGDEAGYPATNLLDTMRSRYWKPSIDGYFVIETGVNDRFPYTISGSPVHSTLAGGTYTGPELVTMFNGIVGDFDLSYSTTTHRFSITHLNGDVETFRGSATTRSVADTIGFNDSDIEFNGAVSFEAPQIRNHTYNAIKIDLIKSENPTFLGAIWPINEASGLSENAVIELRANNVDDMENADLVVSLEVSENGLFNFMDLAKADNDYRYWELRIDDKANFNYYSDFRLSYLYLGDHFAFSTTNIAQGFNMELVDPTIRQDSEGGQAYYLLKNKYWKFDALQTQLIQKADRDEFQQLFFDLGIATPFFISIDPSTSLTNKLDDLTKFATIDQSPKFSHVFLEYFNMSFSMREVV